MLITNTPANSAVAFQAKRAPAVATQAQAESTPTESFESSGEKTTPLALKAGKWALAAGTTAGVGALGFYAGSQIGSSAGIAGAVVGGIAGAAVLGTAGLFADVGGGIFGSGDKTLPMTIIGGVLGAAAGGAAAALTSSSVVGTVLAVAGGLSALAVTGAATNILHK